jgi:hypothetical protein
VLSPGAIAIPIAADSRGSAGGDLENGHVVDQFRKGPAGLLVPVQQSQHQGSRVFVQHTDRKMEEFVRWQFRVIAQQGKPAHVVPSQAAPGHSWPQRPLVSGDERGIWKAFNRTRGSWIGIVVSRGLASCAIMRSARTRTDSGVAINAT